MAAIYKEPNLLHIFADEMRGMAMSCAGNANLSTPNMDRLADEGARFTRMYTPSPLCSPARSSMMTGMYPHNAGVTDNAMRLKADVPCIAEVTRKAGYRTAHIGKWHIEGTTGGEASYDFVPPERHRGFGYWAGFEHGHRYWKGKYYLQDDSPKLYGGYEPDIQTDQAIGLIREYRESPWHLDLSWGPPHFPLAQARPADIALFEPTEIELRANVPETYSVEARQDHSAYYAMIVNLDWNLGRILAVLAELDLTDNTIVVFTSDHGDMLFSHGQHYKRRPEEESVRVPFLIRYPRIIDPGQVVDTLSSLVDEVPTFLDLMGIEKPEMEGISHADKLRGGGYAKKPDSVYIQCPRLGCRAYDPGCFSPNPWRAIRTDRYKATYVKSEEENSVTMIQLFDLESDPFESTNLLSQEIDHSIVSEMNRRLVKCVEETGDTDFKDLEIHKPCPCT